MEGRHLLAWRQEVGCQNASSLSLQSYGPCSLLSRGLCLVWKTFRNSRLSCLVAFSSMWAAFSIHSIVRLTWMQKHMAFRHIFLTAHVHCLAFSPPFSKISCWVPIKMQKALTFLFFQAWALSGNASLCGFSLCVCSLWFPGMQWKVPSPLNL